MIEMESSNKGNPTTSRSLADIRCARENRTAEAMRIKDEQIRILTEQNNNLLEAIEKGEEEISALQLEKLHVDEENRQLRESNFSVQSKAKVTDDELENRRLKTEELEKQLQVVTSQHADLLKMVESEDATNARLAGDLESCQLELHDLKAKYATSTKKLEAKTDEAENSSNTCKLRDEEVRILKNEINSLKTSQKESNMKSSVEIDSLQEQLRVRKEKQYQLLEKLQRQEEARRKAEDQVSSLEESLRSMHSKSSQAETQLQLEICSNLSQTETIKKLSQSNEVLKDEIAAIRDKAQTIEQDNMRMETEARESSEKLREMAEKVFQLLERLKIAELGKTRSMEALRGKEEEVHVLKKKNNSLMKDKEKEEKLKTKLQMDRKVLEEQLKDLKKQTIHLGQKCREEARLKIRIDDEKKEIESKLKTLNGRVSFLLNKLQIDEQARIAQKEDIDKLQNQLQSSRSSCHNLEQELEKSIQNAKALTDELGSTVQELDTTKIKLDALQQQIDEQDEMNAQAKKREQILNRNKQDENPLLAGGRLRFFVESKPTLGIFSLKAKCAKDRDWLETNDCNLFMKKASKSQNRQDLLLQKIAEIYGIILTYEEQIESLKNTIERGKDEVEKLDMKVKYMHDKLSTEEESKRRTLLKYINAVKASVSLGEEGCEKDREEVGKVGAGRINLPEASLTDEEVHAITALLRKNETIAVLNLQGNVITDEGCRSLSSVLSGPSSLQTVDLRRNRITRNGIKLIVEALERSDRVRHVHVHAGGKIEAMGGMNNNKAGEESNNNNKNESSIVCTVDLRENSKPEDSVMIEEEMFGLPVTFKEMDQRTKKAPTKQNISKEKTIEGEQEKRRKLNQQQITKAKEEKETRENGWVGRAGGLQVTKSSNIGRNRMKVKPNNCDVSKMSISKNQIETDNKMSAISPFS